MTDAGKQIKSYHALAGTEPDPDWFLVAQDGNEGTAANATISVPMEDLYKAQFATATEVTVATGVLTVTLNSHKVQPESGTADDIDTISGMKTDTTLFLWPTDEGTDTLTFKHGTGNLSCLGATDLALGDGMVICHYDGTTVYVLGLAASSGISNVVEDTTPQLGGQLDVNGNAIGDGTRELITFTEDGSAVNQVNIENEATGAGPIISAAGDDANIDLNLNGKATGNVVLRDGTDVTKDLVFELAGATTAKTTTIASSQTDDRTITLPDLTGTLITDVGSANIVTLGTIATGVWQGTAINATYLDGQSGTNTGDEAAADLTTAGVIEIATGAETNTGTDATRAVSPDGLDDWTGSAQVTTVGTLAAGDVDAAVTAASLTAAGKVELLTTAEINTGTDTGRAIPIDQYVASNRNVRYIFYRIVASDTSVAADTDVGGDLEFPFTGTITEVGSFNDTPGITGTQVVDIHLNGTTIMTTDKLDTDTTEKTTRTAATAPTLTTTAITEADILTFDIDAIHSGTAALGLTIRIGVRMT